MPLTGAYAWKTPNLSNQECIDHFFNLIDHAVEHGTPLAALYHRKHVETFFLYLCSQCPHHPNKGQLPVMPQLTITSKFASSLVIGEPGVLTIPFPLTLLPKETTRLEITAAQLRHVLPSLEKIKNVGWIEYAVDTEEAVAPVPIPAPIPAPVPVEVPAPIPTPIPTQIPTKLEEPTKLSFFDKKNRNK